MGFAFICKRVLIPARLTYWVVYAFFNIIETFADIILSWCETLFYFILFLVAQK